MERLYNGSMGRNGSWWPEKAGLQINWAEDGGCSYKNTYKHPRVRLGLEFPRRHTTVGLCLSAGRRLTRKQTLAANRGALYHPAKPDPPCLSCQANYYEATMRTIMCNKQLRPWFGGVYWWKWSTDPDPWSHPGEGPPYNHLSGNCSDFCECAHTNTKYLVPPLLARSFVHELQQQNQLFWIEWAHTCAWRRSATQAGSTVLEKYYIHGCPDDW